MLLNTALLGVCIYVRCRHMAELHRFLELGITEAARTLSVHRHRYSWPIVHVLGTTAVITTATKVCEQQLRTTTVNQTRSVNNDWNSDCEQRLRTRAVNKGCEQRL